MLQLSKRVRFELLIAGAILLGSCDDHSSAETYDLADVANVNARNALARCDELESRINDIETKLNM